MSSVPLNPGDPGSRPNPIQAEAVLNGVLVPAERWAQIKEALDYADSILSLLHHRGATVQNQFMHDKVRGKLVGMDGEGVGTALNKVTALTRGGALDDVVRSAVFASPA